MNCFIVIIRTSCMATKRVAKFFIHIALLPDYFRALRDNCSNTQSDLENQSDRATLWSRGGVGVRKPGLFDPLSATIRSQPPRTQKVQEVTCRGLARANIFSDRTPDGHSSTPEKRSDGDWS
jgi:hypothetical protein